MGAENEKHSQATLLHATDVVLDKLLFDRQIGSQSTVTPDTYLQHFKDASEDTQDYKTDSEIRLDVQTQKVMTATDEIDQILDKSEVQLNSASNSLML
ncbi:hypothetical protein JZU71_02810, partial [bacterium]|nr:hypothetical protein [bacterium]